MMKIWIDVTNSPHVLFFNPILKQLNKEGHSCLVTARNHSHTIDLLKKFKINYTEIGSHHGKSLINKAFGYYTRNRKLKHFLVDRDIDVAISHQSPYSASVSKALGISKRIYVFDNEHAKWQNWLAFRGATHVLCPSVITGNYTKYNSIKEAVYMCDFVPDSSILQELELDERSYIVFRPEPFNAAYYKGSLNSQMDFLSTLIRDLPSKMVIIPRDNSQKSFYKNFFGDKVLIPDKVVDSINLIYFSSLLIGGGGTMNREAAVLGTPVLSTYDGSLLAVDNFLIKNEYMFHSKEPNIDLVRKIKSSRKDNNLMIRGKSSRKKILDFITEV